MGRTVAGSKPKSFIVAPSVFVTSDDAFWWKTIHVRKIAVILPTHFWSFPLVL